MKDLRWLKEMAKRLLTSNRSRRWLPHEREYEYRDLMGRVTHRAFSRNACLFRLEARRDGKTLSKGIDYVSALPLAEITIHVVSTGERVGTIHNSEHGVRLTEEGSTFFRL